MPHTTHKNFDLLIKKRFNSRTEALSYIKRIFPSSRTTHTRKARILLKQWLLEKSELSFREIEIRSIKHKIPIQHFQKAARQLKLNRQARGFGPGKTSYWSLS